MYVCMRSEDLGLGDAISSAESESETWISYSYMIRAGRHPVHYVCACHLRTQPARMSPMMLRRPFVCLVASFALCVCVCG